MKFSTATFTFGEVDVSQFTFSNKCIIRYCSYCGNRAKQEDIGCSYNHRWEEEVIHFCDCNEALKEFSLKIELSNSQKQVREIESRLKELERKTDNHIVNKIKFEHEVSKLKKQYKIAELDFNKGECE